MKTPPKTAASRKLGISELLGNSGFLNQRVIADSPITHLQESTARDYAVDFRLQAERNAGPEARSPRSPWNQIPRPKSTRPEPQNLRPADEAPLAARPPPLILRGIAKKPEGGLDASRLGSGPSPHTPLPAGSGEMRRLARGSFLRSRTRATGSRTRHATSNPAQIILAAAQRPHERRVA